MAIRQADARGGAVRAERRQERAPGSPGPRGQIDDGGRGRAVQRLGEHRRGRVGDPPGVGHELEEVGHPVADGVGAPGLVLDLEQVQSTHRRLP